MSDRLKEDFPVDWEDDHFVTRREFFKFLTLSSGGVAFGTAALAVYANLPKGERSFAPARICSVNNLGIGTSLAFSYPRNEDICLLIRKKDGQFVAYSRSCTHLSCPVGYEVGSEGERIYCPCHNGAFSVEDGKVLQGPPPHPLPRIVLEIRDGDVWATGVRTLETT